MNRGPLARDDLASARLRRPDGQPVRWRTADSPVAYAAALAEMEAQVAAIAAGRAAELVWLLEHPPLYTAGTATTPADLAAAPPFPLIRTGRGGQLTYHGPGQRVAYAMLDLTCRGSDVRRFVAGLETWLIATLDRFNVRAARREDRVGVWVPRPDKGPGHEDKIAALGIRVRRGVTFHGVSLNVEPDLAHFAAIVPCGIAEARFGVTSLVDLGLPVTMAEVDMALRAAFLDVFGPIDC